MMVMLKMLKMRTDIRDVGADKGYETLYIHQKCQLPCFKMPYLQTFV